VFIYFLFVSFNVYNVVKDMVEKQTRTQSLAAFRTEYLANTAGFKCFHNLFIINIHSVMHTTYQCQQWPHLDTDRRSS